MARPMIEIPDYVKTDIPHQVATALAEDVGTGDITALLVPEGKTASATIITREEAVICGTPWVEEVFRQLPGDVSIHWQVEDGETVAVNTVLCKLRGESRKILTGERTALNFLQLLSGTATTTRDYVRAAGENITVLDTRKTLPGLRTAQKYAVRCGGGGNHRIGLFDQFLIKENHIAAAGGILAAILRARELAPEKKLTIEVESIEELHKALEGEPDRIMLDDFTHDDIQKALNIIPDTIEAEISGNQEMESLSGYAFSRRVFVSAGALTKNARAIDLSLRLDS